MMGQPVLRDATAHAACSVSECIENAGNTSTECTGCSTGRRVTQHGLSRHTPVCPHPQFRS